jgi:hypothetical protein
VTSLRTRFAAALPAAAGAAALLALAACGGGGPSSLATGRTTTAATPVATAPATSTATSGAATTAPPASTAPPTTAGTTTTTTARPDIDISIVVPGDQAFTDTSIDVKAGDAIVIDATGTVAHSPAKGDTTGPDGDNRPDLNQFNVVTNTQSLGAGHGALLAKVGDGRPFVVGHHDEFTAGASGRLFLGINDTGVDNNAGQFNARVSVTKR